jgi:hypothetical protein
MYTHTCIYIHIYIYIYAYIYIAGARSLPLCLSVCLFVCLSLCIYTHTYIHTVRERARARERGSGYIAQTTDFLPDQQVILPPVQQHWRAMPARATLSAVGATLSAAVASHTTDFRPNQEALLPLPKRSKAMPAMCVMQQ